MDIACYSNQNNNENITNYETLKLLLQATTFKNHYFSLSTSHY